MENFNQMIEINMKVLNYWSSQEDEKGLPHL